MLGNDMNLRNMMQMMQSKDGMMDVLQQGNGGNPSFAAVFATFVNLSRLDQKAMADAAGTDLELNLMTEERAAEVLAGMVQGEQADLLHVFDDLQDRRDHILSNVCDEDTIESLEAKKPQLSSIEMEPDYTISEITEEE